MTGLIRIARMAKHIREENDKALIELRKAVNNHATKKREEPRDGCGKYRRASGSGISMETSDSDSPSLQASQTEIP